MSRCFPFPPPGYVRIGASGDDALIDSIKLQKERLKAQAQLEKRKENRDKKVKGEKNEKKEKHEKRRDKHGDNSDAKKKRVSDKGHQVIKSKVEYKEKHLQKKTEDVAEQLEKSCLTEELEQLNNTNICYSSDSTQSGNKRKLDSLSSNNNQSNGSIILIRKARGKHKEADTPLIQRQSKSGSANHSNISQLRAQDQRASANTTTSIVAKELTHVRKERVCAREKVGLADPDLFPSTNNAMELTHRINERVLAPEQVRLREPDLLPSTSGKKESLPVEFLETPLKVSKKLLKKDKLYKALFEDWVPSPLLSPEPADDDDQDWLFKKDDDIRALLSPEPADDDDQDWLFKKDDDIRVGKRLKPSNDSPLRDCQTYGPGAHFLHDVEIYALPYVVPF